MRVVVVLETGLCQSSSRSIYDGLLPSFPAVGVLSSTFGMTSLSSRSVSSSPD